MVYAVVAKTVAPVAIAVMRRQALRRDLAVAIPAACGDVWNVVRARGLIGAGRHVAVYLDSRITFECGVELATPFAGDGTVFPSATPAGGVACTRHIGGYERLGDAHSAHFGVVPHKPPLGRGAELGIIRSLDR